MLTALAVVLLAGTSTALVGPLVFCGLLVPHAVRVVVGGALALGATFLVGSLLGVSAA